MSGLDFQQQLQKAVHQIPIIFITGRGDIPMTVNAMKFGGMEFLTNPFDGQKLLDTVEQTLACETPSVASKSPRFQLYVLNSTG
jgi:FixJ family two-component response regulator